MWKGKLTGTELVSQISNRQDRTLSSSRLLLQDHVDLYVKRESGPLSFGTWTRTASGLGRENRERRRERRDSPQTRCFQPPLRSQSSAWKQRSSHRATSGTPSKPSDTKVEVAESGVEGWERDLPRATVEGKEDAGQASKGRRIAEDAKEKERTAKRTSM